MIGPGMDRWHSIEVFVAIVIGMSEPASEFSTIQEVVLHSLLTTSFCSSHLPLWDQMSGKGVVPCSHYHCLCFLWQLGKPCY